MIANIPTDAAFDRLNARLKDLAAELFDGLRTEDDNLLIEQASVLSGEKKAGQERIYRLTDGNVPATLNGRVLFYYEPGEMIGIESAFGVGSPEACCEFAIRADVFDREKTFKKIRKDATRFGLLMEYMATQAALLQYMVASTMAANKRPHFQMRSYAAGDSIIRQGDTDTEVYSMISGKADVLVDERKVGDIGEGEIFGEMSKFTGEPRSATVRAASRCEVMVFGGEDFVSLADSNPTALKDIARNLSERLAHLNKEVSQH